MKNHGYQNCLQCNELTCNSDFHSTDVCHIWSWAAVKAGAQNSVLVLDRWRGHRCLSCDLPLRVKGQLSLAMGPGLPLILAERPGSDGAGT